jgi:hypothetical protein
VNYERVHSVWEYWDGVRTGIAELEGVPHYFASQFDCAEDEYSDEFKLYPIDVEVVTRAARFHEIYRNWEQAFYRGEAKSETHPGFGGIDAEYDELKSWLDVQLARLPPLAIQYVASFRTLPGQDSLPLGMTREIEVAWLPSLP